MQSATSGPVPRTYRVPELFADLGSVFARVPALISIWVGGRLPRAMREKVIVSVAQANACRMCEHAHTRMALEAGVTDAELAALERMDAQALDRRTWLALAYARERASADFTPVSDPDLQRAVESELGVQTVRDVEDVARVMTVANRIANTVARSPEADSPTSCSSTSCSCQAPGSAPSSPRSASESRRSPYGVRRAARYRSHTELRWLTDPCTGCTPSFGRCGRCSP